MKGSHKTIQYKGSQQHYKKSFVKSKNRIVVYSVYNIKNKKQTMIIF